MIQIANIFNNTVSAQEQIDKITQFRRRKRYIWLVAVGTVISQLLIACGVIVATTSYTSDELDKMREAQKKDREMLEEVMQINHMRNNLTITLMNKIKQLESEGKSGDSLNELLNIASQSLNNHERFTQKYMNILNNNFKQHFFEINNYETFEKAILDVNSLLQPYARLPSLDPYELLDVSSLSFSNNKTHISVHTKIPILHNKNTYSLYEFVPIPVKEYDNVKILNTNAKLFFHDNNNKTRVMLPQTLKHCQQLSKNTICDSILHESLFDMDTCMSAIVSNKTIPPHCEFKTMEKRNYFVKLSPHSVFCFIVSPIQFRIVCNDREKIYKLTENGIVYISDQCDIHKLLNDIHYDMSTFSSIETNEILLKPNFSIFDDQLNNWTDIQFVNQFNITMTKLSNMTDELKKKVHTETDKTTSIFSFPTKIYNSIGNFFSSLRSNIFMVICILLFVPIFIFILIFFICVNCTKK